MNIYEKLNKAKLALQSGGLKKSGRNDFAKYEYFELSDFIPTILRLENELGSSALSVLTQNWQH